MICLISCDQKLNWVDRSPSTDLPLWCSIPLSPTLLIPPQGSHLEVPSPAQCLSPDCRRCSRCSSGGWLSRRRASGTDPDVCRTAPTGYATCPTSLCSIYGRRNNQYISSICSVIYTTESTHKHHNLPNLWKDYHHFESVAYLNVFFFFFKNALTLAVSDSLKTT